MSELVAELARRGVDADDSALTRALYSSDASLYRVQPAAVARPRHRDELEAILEAAATAGSSVTMRGAGTSIAGNAVGEGIVVDTRRLDRVLALDPDARTARVEPGIVHAALQRAAAPYGLRYGPDPSTHTRCTIGGMVGNNACGSRALGYGRTADTIVDADVIWGDRSAAPGEVEARLAAVVAAELAHVRTSFGQFSRQVSGYSLEHLLPELAKDGRGVARFLAGSEGTLGLLREVTVSLVPEEERDLLVLGYPSMIEAADAVPALLAVVSRLASLAPQPPEARMIACEGLDARIADLVRARGGAVPELPKGSGWLFVEVAGPERAAAMPALVAASGALDSRIVGSPRRGRGAVADPRGRRRSGGAQPVAAGVLRLGGRRRPARAPGCVAAGLRRAAARAPPRRRAVRTLRRRLRARADRLRLLRRPGGVPGVPGGLRRAAARARRIAVGRARRRPGAVGAAAADVRRDLARALRCRQARLRPRRAAQPGRAGRSPAARRRPPSRSAAALRRTPGRGGPPLHGRREVRGAGCPAA